jgi:flotillin
MSIGVLIAVLLGIGLVFIGALYGVVRNLLFICQPNEVLIFIGGRSAAAQRQVGYRVIKGGRAIRVPFFELVDRMDLTNMPIEVAVKGAYSKGGIPLNVHGIANVKIAGEQPVLDNAIERFLGVPRERIMEMARETLEGNLRGVLATLTPEEVNEDKIKFAQSLLSEAEDDLRALGLELDTLKIQDVSDDLGYLDSIGRKQSAEVQKNAVIAEARSKAEAAIRGAQNRQETEISQLQAKLGALRAEVGRRKVDAETRVGALVAEAQGQVATRIARAEADVAVQRARVEQVRRRLQADVLEPARARRAADEAEAKGASASIVEQGRATATALEELATTWKQIGTGARDVFLMQKVNALVGIVMGSMGQLKIDRFTVLGGGVGHGEGTPMDLSRKVLVANEQLKAAAGVDLLKAVQQRLEPPARP